MNKKCVLFLFCLKGKLALYPHQKTDPPFFIYIKKGGYTVILRKII